MRVIATYSHLTTRGPRPGTIPIENKGHIANKSLFTSNGKVSSGASLAHLLERQEIVNLGEAANEVQSSAV
jgi:hypothetical protein